LLRFFHSFDFFYRTFDDSGFFISQAAEVADELVHKLNSSLKSYPILTFGYRQAAKTVPNLSVSVNNWIPAFAGMTSRISTISGLRPVSAWPSQDGLGLPGYGTLSPPAKPLAELGRRDERPDQ